MNSIPAKSILRFCIFPRMFCCRNLSTSKIVKNIKSQVNDDFSTSFGYQKVNSEDKSKKVSNVFHTVADNYDIMNDVMSAGIHRLWKDAFIERLGPTRDTELLDVAGGTGDIAFRFLNYLRAINNENSNYKVTICDICENMLNVGKERAKKLSLPEGRINWVHGNAESLPFADNSFSAYTIAFGIRNVTHIDKVLDEAYRILKPGGRFLCLEFSQVNNEALKKLYDLYSFQLIPVMGQVIAGDWKSYQYLVESIRMFPNQETFKKMIQNAGFWNVTFENMTFGVVAIHSGFKL